MLHTSKYNITMQTSTFIASDEIAFELQPKLDFEAGMDM